MIKGLLESFVAKFRELSKVKRGLMFAILALAGLLVLGRLTPPTPKPAGPSIAEYLPAEDTPEAAPMGAISNRETDELKQFSDRKDLDTGLTERERSAMTSRVGGAAGLPYATPLMAHSAELAVATKDFSKSRSSLEEILQQHRGYAARLRMAGRRTGSVLSATLRVPSPELAATISDLKALGDVEQETQSADEVTQQHADLGARLANARGTLRRLQDLLQKQTYPDGNVRELQRQIANASGEVNRLEAEQTAAEHRVTFANVQFSLREVVGRPEESLSAQFRGAAAAGFGEAAASLSAILLFLIGRGPVMLFWMGILFFPARLVWRRLAMHGATVAPVARA